MTCLFDLSLDDLDECRRDKMANYFFDELLDVLTAYSQSNQQEVI